jgi:hypothetical protein
VLMFFYDLDKKLPEIVKNLQERSQGLSEQ